VCSTSIRVISSSKLESALSSSIESGSHIRANLALEVVLHSRSLKALELAQKIASKRSGARGADARKALLVAEANVVEAEKR
jgi:ATP-binding cassette, subfamily F, member 3